MTLFSPGMRGFTLVELAIVAAIVGLLLGGLLMGMSAQIELQRTSETRATLERVRDALIGFAAANGRLPCPATSASNGAEHPSNAFSGITCTGDPPSANGVANGFVPGVTLGVTPTDPQGFVIDGWGDRVRYSVYVGQTTTSGSCPSSGNTNVFTTTDRMRTIGMKCMMDTSSLLSVCSTGAGAVNTCDSSAVTLTDKAPAVIYSLGRNGAIGGSGTDERANPNPNSSDNNRAFVSHDPTPAGAPNGEFDDIMTWLSLPVLFNRMIVAGRLP